MVTHPFITCEFCLRRYSDNQLNNNITKHSTDKSVYLTALSLPCSQTMMLLEFKYANLFCLRYSNTLFHKSIVSLQKSSYIKIPVSFKHLALFKIFCLSLNLVTLQIIVRERFWFLEEFVCADIRWHLSNSIVSVNPNSPLLGLAHLFHILKNVGHAQACLKKTNKYFMI